MRKGLQWTYFGVPCVGGFLAYPVVKICQDGTSAGHGAPVECGRGSSGSNEEGEGVDV